MTLIIPNRDLSKRAGCLKAEAWRGFTGIDGHLAVIP